MFNPTAIVIDAFVDDLELVFHELQIEHARQIGLDRIRAARDLLHAFDVGSFSLDGLAHPFAERNALDPGHRERREPPLADANAFEVVLELDHARWLPLSEFEFEVIGNGLVKVGSFGGRWSAGPWSSWFTD